MDSRIFSRHIGRGFAALAFTILFAFVAGPAGGDDSDVLKVRARPNVLLLLDDSGSMYGLYGGSEVGDLDGEGILYYPQFNQTGWTSTRADVSMKVLYSLLNANNSIPTGCSPAATTPYPTNSTEAASTCFRDNIDASNDEPALDMRLGLMKFPSNSSAYYTILKQTAGSSSNQAPFSPTYQEIWTAIKGLTADYRATPTALALQAVRTSYFVTAATGDNSVSCRKRFAVLLTDGEDTLGMNPNSTGNGGAPNYYDTTGHYGNISYFNADGWSGSNTGQVARNNSLIQQAKLLADNNVMLFVIGIGLNADPGGVDRPHLRALREAMRRTAEQTGDTSINYTYVGTNGDNTARGAGRVFFASNATDLQIALTNAFDAIIILSASFTAPVVPAVRTTDNNRIYISTFKPDNPPATYWEGHLSSYNLAADGTLPTGTPKNWDAGDRLDLGAASHRDFAGNPRKIYTSRLVSGSWTRALFDKSTSWIDNNMLGVTASYRPTLIDNDVLRTNQNKRLGDIYHSTPVVVGAPSRFYPDAGYSTLVGTGASQPFRDIYVHRQRVIYAGANDGMLHAFNAGTWDTSAGAYNAGDGEELFGYIPNHLLGKLKNLTATSTTSHPYMIDSSPHVSDVWVDSNDDNNKDTTEWKTVLISGERKGGRGIFALDITKPDQLGTSNYPIPLWEITDNNVANLGETWSEPVIGKVRIVEGSVTKDRWVAFVGGGYWANTVLASGVSAGANSISVVTTTGFPASSTSTTPTTYLSIGADNAITYTGVSAISFIGIPTSGANRIPNAHVAGEIVTFSTISRGFYIVDIKLGKVIWKFEPPTDSAMRYPLTSTSVALDSNSDGYVDTVYALDLGGQVWRFDLGTAGTFDNTTNTITAGWSGKRVFAATGLTQRSFNKVEVAFDAALNRWVFFGTGDRERPEAAGKGRFYAFRDDNPSSPYTESSLSNFTSVFAGADNVVGTITSCTAGSGCGWYADMPNTDEKILSDPVVFNNKLYFTTFQSNTTNLCLGGGNARLYGVALSLTGTGTTAGAGVLSVGGTLKRSLEITGGGIPSSPVISMAATGGASLYVGTTNAGLQVLGIDTISTFKRLKRWKEYITQ